ncbi:hypothetical protein AK812_SmicGene17272 [Symbiodinium microadriaticum]|uniref:Uncharacterized protein n=1 Tax=Symbiodinium microadriaticum TaxID=2951 RepID=A0A1Q9DY50_SYMMI|nr:hypothetical protein AK812_SmicGene17272 [Symbiodinium microadriaticum]
MSIWQSKGASATTRRPPQRARGTAEGIGCALLVWLVPEACWCLRVDAGATERQSECPVLRLLWFLFSDMASG